MSITAARKGDRSKVRVVLSIITRDADGKVLMLRRAPGCGGRWIFPGGRVEPSETLSAACRREVFEETGLTVDPVKQIGRRTSPEESEENLFYFSCRVKDGVPSLREPDKFVDLQWFSPEEVAEKAEGRLYKRVRSFFDRERQIPLTV